MKRLVSVSLFMSPEHSGAPVLKLALTGNVFCEVRSVSDVRWIVSSLLDAQMYADCYIEATYDDNSREMIPPARIPDARTVRPRICKNLGLYLAA